MSEGTKPPTWFWVVAGLLVAWEVMGCFACVAQMRHGAAAMGPVDDWSARYYAALPGWYNPVYAVATFGGLAGGVLLLLLRRSTAVMLFAVSLVAVVVMFGWAFLATDLVAHKGLAAVLPFPLVIAAIGAFSVGFARASARRGWLR